MISVVVPTTPAAAAERIATYRPTLVTPTLGAARTQLQNRMTEDRKDTERKERAETPTVPAPRRRVDVLV